MMNTGKSTLTPRIRPRSTLLESSSTSSNQPPNKKATQTSELFLKLSKINNDILSDKLYNKIFSFLSYTDEVLLLDTITKTSNDFEFKDKLFKHMLNRKELNIEYDKDDPKFIKYFKWLSKFFQKIPEKPLFNIISNKHLSREDLETIFEHCPEEFYLSRLDFLEIDTIPRGWIRRLQKLESLYIHQLKEPFDEDDFNIILSLPKLKSLRIEEDINCLNEKVIENFFLHGNGELDYFAVQSEKLTNELIYKIAFKKGVKYLGLFNCCVNADLFTELSEARLMNKIEAMQIDLSQLKFNEEDEDYNGLQAVLNFPQLKILEVYTNSNIDSDNFKEATKDIMNGFPKFELIMRNETDILLVNHDIFSDNIWQKKDIFKEYLGELTLIYNADYGEQNIPGDQI